MLPKLSPVIESAAPSRRGSSNQNEMREMLEFGEPQQSIVGKGQLYNMVLDLIS